LAPGASARAPSRRPDGLAQPSHIVNWTSFGMTADTVSASFGAGGARDDLESKRRNTLAFDYFSDLTGPPPEISAAPGSVGMRHSFTYATYSQGALSRRISEAGLVRPVLRSTKTRSPPAAAPATAAE